MRQIVLEVKYGERRKEIGFPCTEQDLQEAMKDLDVRENYGAKLFVPKIVHPAFLQDLEDGFINLDEINYLAKRMDSFIQEEMDEFAAVVTQEKMTEPKDLINLTFNLNAYTLIQDVSNMAAIGRKQLLSMRGAVSCEEMDKTDLAAIGRELVNSCKGTFTEYGLLFRNKEIEMQEVYDGQVFPQYSYSGDELTEIAVTFNGKTEHLYLPEEPTAITKALERLGAPVPDVCSYQMQYCNKLSGEWEEILDGYLGKENIYDINNLAQLLDDVDMDLDKLMAVMYYADTDSLYDIIHLTENICEFEYIAGANNSEDVGKDIIEKEYDVPGDLEDYIMYEAYGEDFERSYDGKFVYGGFVYINGNKTLNEILGHRDMEMAYAALHRTAEGGRYKGHARPFDGSGANR